MRIPKIEVAPYWMRHTSGGHQTGEKFELKFFGPFLDADTNFRFRILDGDAYAVRVLRLTINCCVMPIVGTLDAISKIHWDIHAGMKVVLEVQFDRAVDSLVVQMEEAP